MTIIQGTTGNDTLTGTTGADQLIGGAGNDVYIVNHTGDDVVEYALQNTGTLTVLDTNSSGVVSNGFNNTLIGVATDFSKMILESDASNLVANDTNNRTDYFLKNLQTGAVTRINTNSNGTLLNGSIEYAETDWAASKLAFISTATNTGFSSSNQAQIYMKDIASGQLSLVSASSNGTASNNANNLKLLEVSDNGRYVLFQSDATNLVSGDTNNQTDLFVKDTQTGAITRVNTTSSGGQTTENTSFPNYFWNASLSSDASKVLFSSYSPQFFNGDTTNTADDFIKDLNTGTVTKLNNLDNTLYDGFFNWLDNTRIIGTEYKLAPGGAITRLSIQDIQTGAITQIDTAANGEAANGFSFEGGVGKGALSHLVFFSSDASNLVSGDTNNIFDLFMKNLNTGAITRINTTSTGAQSIAGADNPDLDDSNQTGKIVYFCDISEDGTKVLFASGASNLVDNDTNNLIDLFIKDLNTGKVTLVTTGSQGQIATTDREGNPFGFFTNPSGTQVYFGSQANGLFTGDITDTLNVFSKQILDAPISIDTGGVDEVRSSISYTLGRNLENLTLTGTAAIHATGNTLNNVLSGNSANNNLNGGLGADIMRGGLGDDTYFVDQAQDVVTEFASAGTDRVFSSVSHTLSTHVENLILTGTAATQATGNTLNNILIGNSANNTLNGGLGIDTMSGGMGNDTYFVDHAQDIITESALAGTDRVFSSVSLSLRAHVENLILTGTTATQATGNELNNTLIGNSANNTLNGGLGIDTMSGGLGNDTYFVDHAQDVVTESASAGTDRVFSSVSYTLGTHVENLILTGTAATQATGNTLNNILIGNSANNTLNGGLGSDTMSGGLGNDTYFVDHVQDVVTESAAAGTDRVFSSVSHTLSAHVENLILTGSTAIDATGNALDNILIGNAANNRFDGGTGMDTISGGLGNDRYALRRGSGTDIITDLDQTVGNTDHIDFSSDILADQLWFSQTGNDLHISVIGTTDQVMLKNWFLGDRFHIEQFHSGNGLTLSDDHVQNLVIAMSTLTPPAQGQLTLNTEQRAQLDTVISASWA